MNSIVRKKNIKKVIATIRLNLVKFTALKN